jgi:hypothetical protein
MRRHLSFFAASGWASERPQRSISGSAAAWSGEGRTHEAGGGAVHIDEWNSDSGFVDKAWTSHSESEPAFISIAVSRRQIVVTTDGTTGE